MSLEQSCIRYWPRKVADGPITTTHFEVSLILEQFIRADSTVVRRELQITRVRLRLKQHSQPLISRLLSLPNSNSLPSTHMRSWSRQRAAQALRDPSRLAEWCSCTASNGTIRRCRCARAACTAWPTRPSSSTSCTCAAISESRTFNEFTCIRHSIDFANSCVIYPESHMTKRNGLC